MLFPNDPCRRAAREDTLLILHAFLEFAKNFYLFFKNLVILKKSPLFKAIFYFNQHEQF